jgi:metal-sulfur cluster biosynthetic enzyme
VRENSYWERTDTFEEKMRLLEAAYGRRDYRLARSIADSLRQSLMLEQQQQLPLDSPIVSGADHFMAVSALPEPWRAWAKGWSFAKILALDETAALERRGEPAEMVLAFRADQTASLAREVRVARVDAGALREVRSQVSEEIRRGAERQCRLTFFADSPAHQRTYWIVFYGNSDAELPRYSTDLSVTGEGVSLDFENEYYRGSLSRQMGQLERLTLKREHGLELFAGGEGHGEPPGIDWAHDYVTSGNFQKLRVTNWPECPDYEVIRGPLSLTVRRWGFPYSTVAPLFSPSRMNIFVEYRFYAGTPWFMKVGSMQVIKEIEIGYLRDDEWVFSGMSFTDIVWMSADGKFHVGPVTQGEQKNLWGVGFMNRDTRDAFMALFLDHSSTGLGELEHTGAPLFYYKWHGHVWSRAMLHNAVLPAGAVLRQRNAYLTMPFPEKGGPEAVERLRHAMMNPLTPSAAQLPPGFRAAPAAGQLARPGEAGDSPIPKRLLWEALSGCLDEQLYAAKPSIVDLGLVYDVRVQGDVVHVVMAMPHRGRPRIGYFSYGSGGNSTPVRDALLKVPGVRKVVVEQTWEPHWNANLLTDEGRRKLGIPAF